MTPTQARKKRAKLNIKIKANKATPAEKAEFARLAAMKLKPGRPRKPAPSESKPASPTVDVATPATPPPVIPDVPKLEGAAPGLDFGVAGFAAFDPAATEEKPAAPVVPDAPVVPTAQALELADQVVGGLAYLGEHMRVLWGFDPLMGASKLVYPALRHAWATVIEESGLAARAESLMNNRNAARVAVISSSLYLGGGGLYAMMELKKRDKAGVVAASAPESEPAKPGSSPPPSEPLADAFAVSERKPEPAPIVTRAPMAPPSSNGVSQMPMAFGGAEDKS